MENSEPRIEQSQQALIGFLEADLDIAFTFLEIANLKTTDPDRSRSLREKANVAVEKIRQMNGRVQDPAIGQRIHARVNKLESALREMG
jgi:hypothetical protein